MRKGYIQITFILICVILNSSCHGSQNNGRSKPLRLRRALFNNGKLPRSTGLWRLKYTQQSPKANDFFESEQGGERILRALRKIHAKKVTNPPLPVTPKMVVISNSKSIKTPSVGLTQYYDYNVAQDSNDYNRESRLLRSPKSFLQPDEDYFNSYSSKLESKMRREIFEDDDDRRNDHTTITSNPNSPKNTKKSFKSNNGDNRENVNMISHQAALKLCQMVEVKKEMEENKKMSFLMIPLETSLPGVSHPVRMERTFLTACSKWMQKSCSGIPKFPLTKDCSFWTPIQMDQDPGCPLLDHRKKINWRNFPPEKCPCKWPCTEEFETVQECYTPSTTGAIIQNIIKETSLSLDTTSVIQLCKAITHGRGTGGSDVINVGWIPIHVQMDQKHSNPKACFSHTYFPCEQDDEIEHASCGIWNIKKKLCNPSLISNRMYNYNSECKCKYPCTPFFNPINECQASSPIEDSRTTYSTSSASFIRCTFEYHKVGCNISPE